MTLVRFIQGSQVGLRCYLAGELAGVPDGMVADLLRRGVVEIPLPVAAPPEAPPLDGIEDSTAPAEGRTLSKRALRKLLRRKAIA